MNEPDDSIKEQRYKLPILKIIYQALLTSLILRNEFLMKLSIPIIFLIVLDYIQWYSDAYYGAIIYIFGFIELIIYIYLAIICHRIVILGGNFVPKFGIRKWTMRETRFLGWFIGINLMVCCAIMLIMILFGFIYSLFIHFFLENPTINLIQIVFMPTSILGFYVLARLSMIFPATAIDERPNINWALDISHGNGWRLVMILGALPLVTGYALGLLEGQDIIFIEDLALKVLVLVVLIIEIVALSISYKQLQINTTSS